MGWKRWTKREIRYLQNYLPVKGIQWVAENMPGRTIHAIRYKAYELGVTLGETYAHTRGKIMSAIDIAVELDMPVNSVYNTIKRSDVEVIEFGSKEKTRARRIAVPREWAEAFIAEQRELRENGKNYSHWWDSAKAAAVLGVNPNTLRFWANGKRDQYLVIKPRVVTVVDGISPRYYLFCPEDIEIIKRQFDEYKVLAKTWIPLKHLEVETGLSQSSIYSMAKKLGNPRRLLARGGWRWHVSPEDAQKIRNHYGVRQAA